MYTYFLTNAEKGIWSSVKRFQRQEAEEGMHRITLRFVTTCKKIHLHLSGVLKLTLKTILLYYTKGKIIK